MSKFTIFSLETSSSLKLNSIIDGLPPKFIPVSLGTPFQGAIAQPNSIPPMSLSAVGDSVTFTNIYKPGGIGLLLRTPVLVLGTTDSDDLVIKINGISFNNVVTSTSVPQNIDIPVDSFTSPLEIIYEKSNSISNIIAIYEPVIFLP